jgi:DNA topoisomerase II
LFLQGLKLDVKYEDASRLRYGHIMIMTDQDHDGSHIKGLIINFFHHFWPSLLEIENFLQVFITPIVKCVPRTGSKKYKLTNTTTFYTTPEYEEWRNSNDDHQNGKKWKIKYYKGLGTSDRTEAKEYFSNLKKNLIPFTTLSNDPVGTSEVTNMIDMCFNKKKAEERKIWINGYEDGTHVNFNVDEMAYSDFVDKEYIIMAVSRCCRRCR